MNPDLLPGGDVRPPDGSNAANMSVFTTATTITSTTITTSLPYFGVKLSCVCLMFAYRNKGPIVTLR